MKIKALRARIGPRGLVLVCLAAPLAACATTPEQRFAQNCRGWGYLDGSPGMARCVEDERKDAQKAAAQMPTGSRYIPPSFQGTGPGCYNCN
jgi:hypothetical protein